MNTGHIYVYGYISPFQDDDPGMYGEVNLKSIQSQIQSQPNADELIVHVNSGGGDVDEGFAIHDVLRSTGKKIITQIEGMCASIATVIALAGDERRMTSNSEYMIHCPMMWGGGTAKEIKNQAEYLETIENKVIDFYVQKTGSDREAIASMMDAETYMNADKAKELGFITEVMATMKAVATINSNNMKDNEKIVENVFQKVMTNLKEKFGLKERAQMITVTTSDGTILDFGDSVTEESEITEGSSATVDGSPANGDYTLTDGTVLTFENGSITEIVPMEEETVDSLKEQLAAKDEEIAQLKESSATALNETKTEMVKEFETQIKEMKAQMLSDLGKDEPEKKPETTDGKPVSRKPFKK